MNVRLLALAFGFGACPLLAWVSSPVPWPRSLGGVAPVIAPEEEIGCWVHCLFASCWELVGAYVTYNALQMEKNNENKKGKKNDKSSPPSPMPAPEAWRCGGYENPGGVLLLEGGVEPTASFDLGRPDPPPNTAELTRVSYWGEAVTV
jgi:hypothetical protein